MFTITTIGFSILLSVNAVLVYINLQNYSNNLFLVALLAIFNPVDLVGLLTWGGISLTITIISITSALILQHNVNRKKILVIIVLIVISSTAHRTGLVIHLVAVIIGLVFHYKKIHLNKETITAIILLFTVFIIVFIRRVYSLTMTYLKQVLNPNGERSTTIFSWIQSNLVLFIVLLVITFLFIYNLFLHRDELQLYTIERLYIASGLILAAVPVYDIVVSSRFIIALSPIILILVIYAFNFTPKKYQKLFILSIIISGYFIITYSIERSISHLMEYWD
ncbi:MAG: hypothetical protein INQ03_20885 [Candidatus Heimdallarchaeota archaeon]|nr:hypothetical protein [Candidatus Heimdallarchaeota archaeon]